MFLILLLLVPLDLRSFILFAKNIFIQLDQNIASQEMKIGTYVANERTQSNFSCSTHKGNRKVNTKLSRQIKHYFDYLWELKPNTFHWRISEIIRRSKMTKIINTPLRYVFRPFFFFFREKNKSWNKISIFIPNLTIFAIITKSHTLGSLQFDSEKIWMRNQIR